MSIVDIDTAFPAFADAYTGATAIGISGVYAGRRMKLDKRVASGSWRRADGTRTVKWSRWVTFERLVIVKDMSGRVLFSHEMEERALIPEKCYMVVAMVVRREEAA